MRHVINHIILLLLFSIAVTSHAVDDPQQLLERDRRFVLPPAETVQSPQSLTPRYPGQTRERERNLSQRSNQDTNSVRSQQPQTLNLNHALAPTDGIQPAALAECQYQQIQSLMVKEEDSFKQETKNEEPAEAPAEEQQQEQTSTTTEAESALEETADAADAVDKRVGGPLRGQACFIALILVLQNRRQNSIPMLFTNWAICRR